MLDIKDNFIYISVEMGKIKLVFEVKIMVVVKLGWRGV